MLYRMNIQEVVRETYSDLDKGLSEQEVTVRLRDQGKSELLKKKREAVFQMFLEQFQDPMAIILIIGIIVSIFLKEYTDASIILTVIILNAIISAVQEFKAEKVIDALEKLSTSEAFVVREGFLKEIDSKELVVGDLVGLEVGGYIPVSMRLVSSVNLKVEESISTGESKAMEKDMVLVYDEEISVSDQRNIVSMSTYVTYGKTRDIVVCTGISSEVDRIARMLDEVKEDMTPLQVRLAHLSKILGVGSVGICIAMFVVAVLQGRDPFDMLLPSISLAVATISEGLPTVATIVLALGVQVMSRNNAIIRKLHVVEALGFVSVICSDETGTLTQSKIYVVPPYANGALQNRSEELLRGFCLYNNTTVQKEEILGKPTEVALMVFCEENGVHKDAEDLSCVRVNEISSDSTCKPMTTIHQHGKEYVAFTRGAPEKMLDSCIQACMDGTTMRMGNYEKNRILEANKKVSSDVQRVLALAMRSLKGLHESAMESKMTFIGFAGLIDPPREGVWDSIRLRHKAGIQVVMITGDHPLTALAIVCNLGIVRTKQQVITGKKLGEMDEEALAQHVQSYCAYARVTPEHKVRTVNAPKEHQLVVAMSGDGVNGAPSLKNADIGIATGKTGTDVCKQASDMILAGDNFAMIVEAVEQGGDIYLNIQKAVPYLLSHNLGEIMSLFLAIVFMPHAVSILSAIQILWVNFATGAPLALALSVDPMDKFIMEEKPRDRRESLLIHGGIIFTTMNGMSIGTITLAAFRNGPDVSPTKAQIMAFMVLSISQLFHALNLCSCTHSILEAGIMHNKWLILIMVFGITLQIAACQLPISNMLLKTVPLDMSSWTTVLGTSFSIIPIDGISKWIAKER